MLLFSIASDDFFYPQAINADIQDVSILDCQNNVSSDTELSVAKPNDSVRVYMKDMSSICLLSRQDEISIAKKIESGTRNVFSTLACYPRILNVLIKKSM